MIINYYLIHFSFDAIAFGIRYGKFCGVGWSGCPGEKPCDDLDACCMAHDECVGKAGNFFFIYLEFELLEYIITHFHGVSSVINCNICDYYSSCRFVGITNFLSYASHESQHSQNMNLQQIGSRSCYIILYFTYLELWDFNEAANACNKGMLDLI